MHTLKTVSFVLHVNSVCTYFKKCNQVNKQTAYIIMNVVRKNQEIRAAFIAFTKFICRYKTIKQKYSVILKTGNLI